MSDHSTHDTASAEVTPTPPWVGFILPLLGFLLFALFTLYIIDQSSTIPSSYEKRAAERLDIMKKLKDDEAAKVGSGYGWIDSAKKIVRLPINRAMEVVLPELQNKAVAPAYPIGGAPGMPAVPSAPNVPQANPAPAPKPTK